MSAANRPLSQEEPLRLLCVHAHPDDESSKGAAMMAKYVDAGVEVLVVSCTGGERGDILNPALKDRADVIADISAVRRLEMANAQAILRVKHQWLGFVDSGLPEGDPLPPLPDGCFASLPVDEAAEPLVRIMREFRPHVVTTYNEQGGYPHPDHIQCHNVSVAAFDAAGDASRYPDAGEPWRPQKLYYDATMNIDRMQTMHEAMLKEGLDSPYAEWIERRKSFGAMRLPVITTRIECGDWFERRDAALLAHATQVDPNGWFFAVPLDIQRHVYPWEEFELAKSHVETSIPESDLFSGVQAAGISAEVTA